MTMKKMDQDKDGRVSFSDFLETVKQVNISNTENIGKIGKEEMYSLQEPLMMEAFGTCLPTGKTGREFLKKILDEESYRHQTMIIQQISHLVIVTKDND